MRVWSRVHVDLPSSSTSGGHSAGGGGALLAWEDVVDFIMDFHEAEDVHVRHLIS